MKKEMLNKIKELDAVNLELFNRKAELEKEILSINIAIFEIVKKYRKFIEALIEE